MDRVARNRLYWKCRRGLLELDLVLTRFIPTLRDEDCQPLFALLQQARAVHQAHWPDAEVQLCTLLSIKTGGCSEDCSYCAQSARYQTGLAAERVSADLLRLELDGRVAALPGGNYQRVK